jgi:protein-S-isoprenylcysteine O-methyltransferase Ste14
MEKKNVSQAHWWKGTRGEWYVVTQIALILLVLFGPRNLPGWPIWISPFTWLGSIGGGVVLLAGILLFMAAIFRLGSNLTAVPYPKDQGTLVETGPYRLVRHPIYCGILLIAIGWAFLIHGWLTLGYAVIMLVFFDIKSRREERWLKEKYLDYSAYQKRVKKLIPFIY